MSHASHLPHAGANPFNRPDRVGATLSALVPLLAALIANGLIYVTGWAQEDQAYDAVVFAPPGWVVAAIWMVIFPMWGLARWRAHQAGESGRRESWWAVALIFWSLAYPVAVVFLDTPGSAWANLASLLFAAFVAWRLSTASNRAAAWVLPSLVWLGFASVLGYAAVSTGV